MSEALTVVSPDGARIAVERTGSGRPLVLVHGTTVNHTDWAPLIPELSRCFSVYAMDRRGLGDSDDPLGYAVEREFEDVAAVVESTGQPAALLGHSFGGLCCIEAAMLTPNVSELIVYEPPIVVDPDFYPPGILQRFED